MKTSLMPL